MSRGKLFPCSLANSLKYLQIYQCSLISRAEIKAHRGLTGSRRPGEAVVVGGDMEAVAAAAVDAFAAAAWPSSPPSPERFERLLLPSRLLLLLLCFLELLCFLGDEGAAPAIAVGDMLTLERMEKSEKNEELKRTENDRKKKTRGPGETETQNCFLSLSLYSASSLLSTRKAPNPSHDNALIRYSSVLLLPRRRGGVPPGDGQALFSRPRPLALDCRRSRIVVVVVERRSPLHREA